MAGKYFGIPFALSGDRAAIPDAAQPDGSVSFTQGFTLDYELENTDPNYKPVPREETNALYYDITEAVGIVQKQGFADWTIDAAPYQINAFVRHSDIVWINTIAANSSEPGMSPTWVEFLYIDSGYRIQIGDPVYVTATGTVVHPAGYTHVLVELVGGGGGGGGVNGDGANTGGAGGGGGGRYSSAMLTAGLVGASTLCTIGAGGNGGTPTGGTGATGGTTSFGTHLTANGGAGGAGTALSSVFNVATGGAGGTSGTGADFISAGGQGGVGQTFGSASPNRGISGAGGISFFGAGGIGRGVLSTDILIGDNGVSPGSGGGGAGVGSSSSNDRGGGGGAAGLIRLTYYK